MNRRGFLKTIGMGAVGTAAVAITSCVTDGGEGDWDGRPWVKGKHDDDALVMSRPDGIELVDTLDFYRSEDGVVLKCRMQHWSDGVWTEARVPALHADARTPSVLRKAIAAAGAGA